ncbi:MAG: winged helix-turn-helix transcriptional regulator [Chloroflexi bacterium]|nr:winged helix-turn-helix transcriptional regulator [Chloroflexota bacterium]
MDLGPWRAFLHAHARLARRLDEDLRDRHALSLQEYETLLHLAEAPDHRLRMGRLADSLLLSKSGVTRLVDRLVDDGLVERSSCSSDARGAEAALTGTGLARLRSAAPTHLAGIRNHFYGAIDTADLAVVGRVMSAISSQLCASATVCDHDIDEETGGTARARGRTAGAHGDAAGGHGDAAGGHGDAAGAHRDGAGAQLDAAGTPTVESPART